MGKMSKWKAEIQNWRFSTASILCVASDYKCATWRSEPLDCEIDANFLPTSLEASKMSQHSFGCFTRNQCMWLVRLSLINRFYFFNSFRFNRKIKQIIQRIPIWPLFCRPFLLLSSCISVVYLLWIMNQYWYIII